LETSDALRNRAADNGRNKNRVGTLHGIWVTANDNSCTSLVAKWWSCLRRSVTEYMRIDAMVRRLLLDPGSRARLGV
jgi:hypothetical protein